MNRSSENEGGERRGKRERERKRHTKIIELPLITSTMESTGRTRKTRGPIKALITNRTKGIRTKSPSLLANTGTRARAARVTDPLLPAGRAGGAIDAIVRRGTLGTIHLGKP